MNRKKKIALLIGALTGMLVISVTACVFLLQTTAFQSFFLKQINQNIPGHLSWDDLTLSVFSGTIDITEIRLEDPQGNLVVKIPRLFLDLSIRDLPGREIVLSSVLIQSPELNLKHTKRQTLNLFSALVADMPDETPSSSGPLLPNIRIHQVVLNSGTFNFKASDPDLDVFVSGWDMTIHDVDLFRQSAQVALEIQNAVVRQDEMVLEASSFRLRTGFFENHLTDMVLQADINGTILDIQGHIRDLSTGPDLDIILEATVDTDAVGRAFQVKAGVTGPVIMKLTAKGLLENPDADLKLTFGPGMVVDQPVDAMVLQSMLRDRILTILPSMLQVPAGKASLDGTVDLKAVFPDGFLSSTPDMDQVRFDLNIRPELTDPVRSPFMKGLFSGSASADIHLTGKGGVLPKITADLQADIRTRQIIFQAAHSPLDARIQIHAGLLPGGRIDLKKMILEHQDSKIEAHGLLDLFDDRFELKGRQLLDLDIAFEALAPVDFFPDRAPGGIFSGTVNLTGDPASPIVTAKIDGKNLVLNTSPIGDVMVEMVLSNGVLTLKQADIIHQNSQLSVQGDIRLFDPGTLEMTGQPEMNLHVTSAAVWLEDYFNDMTGSLSINGKIEGSLEQHDGNLTVEAKNLQIYGQPLERVSGSAAFRNQTITVNRLEIQACPESSVVVSGQVFWAENSMDLNILATDFDLTCLDRFRQGDILQQADLTLDVSARGRMDDPLVDGHIRIRNITVFNEKSDPIDLSFGLKSNRLQVTGNAGPDITGTVHLDTKEFSAVLSMDALTLDPYFQLAGQPALSGKITGNIQAGGRVDRFEDMTVTADIFDAALALNRQPLFTLGPATASWHAGHFVLPGVRIDFEAGGTVMIKGEGSLNHDIDFAVDGSIPFGIISALSDDIRSADGTLQLTAFVRGTIQDPVLQADLMFENLSLFTDFIESGFSHISGHIRATPRDLEIIRFSGRLDKGRYELGGRAGIGQGGLKDLDLVLDAHQLILDFPGSMELMLDSRLVLSGPFEKSLLTGDIMLLDGLYYRDVELDLLSTATRRTRTIQPVEPKERDGFLSHMSLDVDIHHRGLLLVENNLAALQVSPDITIHGTADSPLISGRVRVDSGIITFQKREFEVKKGIIDFINPYRIEPVIDIAGEMSVRSWIITLMVSGTPDNLDLQFSSVPSESHADIISLIAFGRTTREMGNAGGGQFSPEEFVSGLLAEALQKNLRDATGIDELKISTNSPGGSGASGVKVTVGKELSRQMSVSYGVDIRDGETVQRVTTYYKLLENLLLSGFQDTGGKFGGEIKYRMEFR